MPRLTRVPAAVAALILLGAPGARAQEGPVLELSLDEAVRRAMDNNLDIKVEGYNPLAADEGVRAAEGYYDPFLSSVLDKNSRTNPQTNAFSGGDKVTTKGSTWNFGLGQAVPTGGEFSLTFNNNKSDTNSVFTTFNPSYGSGLTLSAVQPLFKNLRLDAPRRQLLLSKKNKEISDVQFRQSVINVLATVKAQYYDLIFAIDNLEATRKSLALAQKLLDENQIKVRVGTMAPLDVVQAQSEVAGREEGVIVAENDLREAEDTLKRSITPGNDPVMWSQRIVPTDRPTAEPYQVDLEAAIRRALEGRTDLQAARKGLERADIDLRYAKSQTLPQVDLIGSYGGTGVGGTQIIRDGFGGPIIETIPGGYGDATSQVFGADYPNWRVGFNLSYPILNRSAKAGAAQARLAREQQETVIRRLEMNVVSEVRTAARAVETNLKRVDSTKAARVLQEQRLDAEEKKFAAGMSTNFLVTQAQRDLATAQVAEVRALADYRKSQVSFERVQEAGVGLGGGSATFSGATAGGTRLSVTTGTGAAGAF
jgi:outer membrane protein TolC